MLRREAGGKQDPQPAGLDEALPAHKALAGRLGGQHEDESLPIRQEALERKITNRRHWCRGCCAAATAATCAVLLLATLYPGPASIYVSGHSHRHGPTHGAAVSQEPGRWIHSAESDLRPTHQRSNSGREFVWQLPVGMPPPGAKGVLLLAPGCGHRATDFWDATPTCPECIGLPEEKQIARAALRHGLAVLAVSPGGGGWHPSCWDTPRDVDQGTDLQPTIAILRSWMEDHGLSDLPVFALGASSGGAFVLALAQRFPLAAVCSQIMAVPQHALMQQPRDAGTGEEWPFPPTLFVHMSRDSRTAGAVSKNLELLRSKGVKVAEVAVHPRAMVPSWFSDRIDGVPEETSIAVHKAFREAGIIGSDGILLSNPRLGHPDWRSALSGIKHLPGLLEDGLVADKSAISEELNVLFAGHEIVADYMEQTLEWFDAAVSRGKAQ